MDTNEVQPGSYKKGSPNQTQVFITVVLIYMLIYIQIIRMFGNKQFTSGQIFLNLIFALTVASIIIGIMRVWFYQPPIEPNTISKNRMVTIQQSFQILLGINWKQTLLFISLLLTLLLCAIYFSTSNVTIDITLNDQNYSTLKYYMIAILVLSTFVLIIFSLKAFKKHQDFQQDNALGDGPSIKELGMGIVLSIVAILLVIFAVYYVYEKIKGRNGNGKKNDKKI